MFIPTRYFYFYTVLSSKQVQAVPIYVGFLLKFWIMYLKNISTMTV